MGSPELMRPSVASIHGGSNIQRALLVMLLGLGLAASSCGVWFGPAGTQRTTTYYAPTLSSDGKRLAYLKRKATWRSNSGLMMWGASYQFDRDTLYLCRATRSGRQEQCFMEWSLPVAKLFYASVGKIDADLAWVGDDVIYRISVTGWAKDGETAGPGATYGPYVLASNVPVDAPFPIPPAARPWGASLDPDPSASAWLIDNRIVVVPGP